MARVRLLLVVTLIFSTGCRPVAKPVSPPAATPTPAPVYTDLAGLQKLISLPRKPIAVTWQYTRIGSGGLGPTDARLVAALQYSPADADLIERAAARTAPTGLPTKVEYDAPSWFPASLQKEAVKGPNGIKVLRGTKMKVDAFAHLSLQNGLAMRVPGTSYFVVSLFTT